MKYPIKLKIISFNRVCMRKRYKTNLNAADRLMCSSKIFDFLTSSWEGILRMMGEIHTHTRTHTRTHTHAHTRTHTRARTHAHARARAHTALILLTLYKDTLTHTKLFVAFHMWVIFHILTVQSGCPNNKFLSLIFKNACYMYVCMWVGTLLS